YWGSIASMATPMLCARPIWARTHTLPQRYYLFRAQNLPKNPPKPPQHSDAPGGALSSTVWGVHDDGDAGQAHQGADDVPPVRAESVHHHSPGQGPGDEHPAVRGQDAAEIGVGLQGGHEPVEAERDDPGPGPQQAALLADALPHQPGAPDLGESGQHEQEDGTGHEHPGSLLRRGRRCTAADRDGRIGRWSGGCASRAAGRERRYRVALTPQTLDRL